MPSPKKLLGTSQPLLLLLSTLFVIAGMLYSGNSLSSPWHDGNYKTLATWLIGGSFVFISIRKIKPEFSATLAASLVLILLLMGSGISAAVSCLLFLAAIFLLGRWTLIKLFHTTDNLSWMAAGVIGLTIYLVIIGTMIHFPVNYAYTYLFILVIPFYLTLAQKKSRDLIRGDINNTFVAINHALSSVSYWQLCGTLIFVGFIGSYAFLPSVTADDNSYHLAMWAQLQAHHQYLFDVTTQIWYAAPFTLDMLHGAISIMAMQDARGPINIFILSFLMLAVLKLSSLVTQNNNYKLLILVLFISTPMVINLILGLQTELLLALLTSSGVCIACNSKITYIEKCLLLVLVCSILISIKLPAGIIAVSLFACFLWSEWQPLSIFKQLSFKQWLSVALLIVIGCAVALHAYINAYLITGNPTFPLYNAIFKSPFYAPTNFKDTTFTKGASLDAYLGFFFNSSKYFESLNFIAGFQYLILPVLGALYLLTFKRHKQLAYLLIPTVVFGGIMFSMMQYWRYMFPILPLASVLAGAMFMPFGNQIKSKVFGKLSDGIFICYLLLNIIYLPGVCWFLNSNPLESISEQQKLETAKKYNNEYVLNHYMNKMHPGENVLFDMTRPSGAMLLGKPFYPSWVSPKTLSAFDGMHNAEDLIKFLKENNIHYAYWSELPDSNSFYFRDFITDTISRYGQKEFSAGNINVYKINY